MALGPVLLLGTPSCGGDRLAERLDLPGDVYDSDARPIAAPGIDVLRVRMQRDPGRIRVDIDFAGRFPRKGVLLLSLLRGGTTVANVELVDRSSIIDGGDGRITTGRPRVEGNRLRVALRNELLGVVTDWALVSLVDSKDDIALDSVGAVEPPSESPEIGILP